MNALLNGQIFYNNLNSLLNSVLSLPEIDIIWILLARPGQKAT